MNVYQLSRQFKADLLARERSAARQMLRQYHEVYAGIQRQLDTLTDKMDAARLEGKEITTGWLFRERRLEALLAQTKAQMAQFGAYAGSSVRLQKYEAAVQAEREARDLVQASLAPHVEIAASWSSLPAGAIESLAGAFQDGGPLNVLFASLGEEAVDRVRSALLVGVATGQGPRVIARTIRDALGQPLARALTISRTETVRAYREASIASYAANDDVVSRWRWTATKTTRTCAMCLAMDGEEFDLDVPFGSHPNCRCVPVPVTKSWEELGVEGIKDTRPQPETGADWFARQSAEDQATILGPAKFELFERGELRISDLVGYRDDPKWGPVRYERSAKTLTAA